ncbi:MAG: hypothetical protein CVU22_17880 [Betaproteobacteria bacterium HGW-Betaproteobacteria-16]|nr:MAG: hypothetical protein CVU22_17880 [Betaproteobacteria bacterium HGW-Betaproteobacteria-16]
MLTAKPAASGEDMVQGTRGAGFAGPRATLSKSPWKHAPGCGMGCKAQTAVIPGGIARICNAADRPQPGCVRHVGLAQRRPRVRPPQGDRAKRGRGDL